VTETGEDSRKKGKRPSARDVVDFMGLDGPEADVLAQCSLVKRGKDEHARWVPNNTALNVMVILANDTRWQGCIRTNEFDGSVYVRMPGSDVPKPMGGTVATQIVQWLEKVYEVRTNEDRVGKTINVIGDGRGYHPVRSRLRSLAWDGKPRCRRLMADYFSAEDTDLNGELGMRWLISAVARVMRPGCKADTMIVLVGPQGARKSTACRVLALDDGWYSDTPLDMQHTKDLYESLHGVWLYEIAEVDSFRRAEWPKVKATISSQTDRYRRPYAAGAEPRARQVIFIGTTNEAQFLGDPTGSRRFWPIRVGRAAVRRLMDDREQLWAEAVALYDQGERWWLDDNHAAALREHSDQFQSRHPWHEAIERWARQRGDSPFLIAEVLGEALQKPTAQWGRADEMAVGGILSELGYVRARQTAGGVRGYFWTLAAS
jgi:putative DNA primase/helicase